MRLGTVLLALMVAGSAMMAAAPTASAQDPVALCPSNHPVGLLVFGGGVCCGRLTNLGNYVQTCQAR